MTVLVEAGLLKVHFLKLYRSEEYDTSRDPRNPLSALSQVLLGSIAKLMTDVGDVSSEILTVISGKRSHEDSGRTGQKVEAKRITSDILASFENPSALLADTPYEVTSARDTESKRSEGQSKTRGERRCGSKFTQFLPKAAAHTGHLVQGMLDIIVVPPMEITLTLSKGFHNTPLLFHDDTVTEIPKVTGMRSGLQAARKELISSVYDGVSGLVSQPRRGLKDSGSKGLVQGIGKGVAGVMLKPMAGLWGVAAYPLTGLHQHLRQSLSEGKQSRIKRARIAQGISEFQCSSLQERAVVIRRWKATSQSGHDGMRFEGHSF